MEECVIASPTSARRNLQIRASQVRVVGEDGTQLGIMPTREAVAMAGEQGLDLVEVAPKAEPPVCRIMDYGKYQYQQKKKQQEARKKQVQIQLKEVKFRPKTDEHDFQTKVRHIRRFLDGGDRCKVTVFFRGREIVHKDKGMEILTRVRQELEEIAKVDQVPKFEGRTMSMVVSPK